MRDTAEDLDDGRPPLELPPEPGAGGVIQKTPWWSISTGMHVVAALALGGFWAVDLKGDEEIPGVVVRM